MAGGAEAANHYVRADATGTNDGSDWTNAWTALPATLTRGDTYYIADGSYGSYTFDDPVSGSTYIYIKKATATDHGTDTGWQNSYGDGQAVLGRLVFNSNTGYIDVDGRVGGGPESWESGHGFKVDAYGVDAIYMYTGCAALNFRHLEVDLNAIGPELSSRAMNIHGARPILIEYCYFHDIGDDIISIGGGDGLTIQYCKWARKICYANFCAQFLPFAEIRAQSEPTALIRDQTYAWEGTLGHIQPQIEVLKICGERLLRTAR